MAALQGIDIDEKNDKDTDGQISSSSKVPTIEEIQARAVARLTGDRNMAGAVSQGFTPDMGVEYKIAEGTVLG